MYICLNVRKQVTDIKLYLWHSYYCKHLTVWKQIINSK